MVHGSYIILYVINYEFRVTIELQKYDFLIIFTITQQINIVTTEERF